VVDCLLAQKSLAHFVRQAWPLIEPATPLVWGWHMDAVCRHLEAVSEGRLPRLIIEIPPGSSKSTIVSVMWPVWHWIKRPATRFLTGSYALGLATRDALRSRRIITSPWFQTRWGHTFRLTGDQNAKSRYDNDRTGYRIALSVGSATTGERGDVTLVDDPHNVREADSEAVRIGTLQWHDEAFYNRLNDPKRGGRVIMGQRVHEQDLTGHLLARGGWEELRIPEEYEPDRPCRTAIGWEDPRREAGELMRPERFGLAERDDAKATLGAVAYAAQHQQRPTPRGGAAFQEEWWREWQPYGTGFNLAGRIIPDHDVVLRFLTVDGAFTVKETSKSDPDFTVTSAWALAKGQLIALGSVWKRLQLPDIPAVVAKEYARWRCQTVYAEGGGTQKGLPQLLRRHDQPALNVVELVPGQQDKLARASDFLLMAEGGRVWWPAAGDYPRDAAKSQLLHFTGTGGGHDDYWDSCAMAGRVAKARDDGGAKAVPYLIRT
jgi:phage terminase large subunit-like protein